MAGSKSRKVAGVAKVFTTAERVNKALRALILAMPEKMEYKKYNKQSREEFSRDCLLFNLFQVAFKTASILFVTS